ncbi:response regulator [Pseudomonas sp. IPO3774]|uniref:response regulator n=1 Tax=Pseudomonas sp. IPO3774 TaxID=2738826 RepID=UPI0015A4C732|nr:response regulator [Pseudomonas sp. IPO3774]NWD64128.1 response regulator [Pseudomonas sp. IPO3774]
MSLLNMMLRGLWHERQGRRIGFVLAGVMGFFWLLPEMIGLYFRYMKGQEDAHTAMRIHLQGVVEREEQRYQYDEMRVDLLMHTWLGLRERLRVGHGLEQLLNTVFIPFVGMTSDPNTLRMAREVISLFGSGAPTDRSNLFLVLPGQGVIFYRPTFETQDLERTAVELKKHSSREVDSALVWSMLPRNKGDAPLLLLLKKDAGTQMVAGQVLNAEVSPSVRVGVQIAIRDRAGQFLRASPELLSSSLLPEHCSQEAKWFSGFYVLCMPMRGPHGSIVMIYSQEIISHLAFAVSHPAMHWEFFAQVLLLVIVVMLFKRTHGSPLKYIISVLGGGRFYNRQQCLIRYSQRTLEQQVLSRTRDLVDAKFKAEQASTRKSEHLANLSHEIRTPLNGVMGALTLLERSNLPSRQLELLRTARQSSALLLDIINDMLDFSRIESGRMVLTYSRIGLLSIFDQALLAITLKAQEKGLKLTAFIAADVPQDAVIDGLRVRQILVNLLGNAVKFTEQGEIRLHAEMRGDRLSVNVSDTGKGIAKECHDMVFQPFVQGSAYDSGSGLGLAIAWRLTQMMDGELSLESDNGAGASFNLCVQLHDASAPLPLFSGSLPAPLLLHEQLREWGVCVVDSPSILLDVPELAHLPGRLWQKLNSILIEKDSDGSESFVCSAALCPWSLKVLIVDDVTTNLRILGGMLHEMGHVVQAVPSAFEALKAGRSHVFDLVLMDIRMPDVDGFTATEIWKKEGSAVLDPDTPIIAVSANAALEEHERAIGVGMCGYLTKPVGIDELAVTLSEIALMQVSRGVEMPPNRNLERPLVDVSDEQVRRAAIAELISLYEQVVAAWRAREQKQVLDALHALKGCAGLVGMPLVSQVVEHLENQIHRDEVLCDESLSDLRCLISSDS